MMVIIEGWKGTKENCGMRKCVPIQRSEDKKTKGRNTSSKKERDNEKI